MFSPVDLCRHLVPVDRYGPVRQNPDFDFSVADANDTNLDSARNVDMDFFPDFSRQNQHGFSSLKNSEITRTPATPPASLQQFELLRQNSRTPSPAPISSFSQA